MPAGRHEASSRFVEVVDVLTALGGAAHWEQLKGTVSRRRLARAVAAGRVGRQSRLYVLPDAHSAVIAARSLHGVASHRSAARHHGFALPPGPDGEDVTLPPRAKRKDVPPDVRLHWHRLTEEDCMGDYTSPVITVLLCLRDLPLREALSVGDSALSSGTVSYDELARLVGALRGPGSAVARARLQMLDARAANAFESCLRATLIEAGITGFRPQVLMRHTRLAAAGWRTLRFTWEQVMFHPDWVRDRVCETMTWAGRAGKTTQSLTDPAETAA